jgi:hypothetical protein
MTASLHCGIALHNELKLDPAWFATGTLVGYQVTDDDDGRPDILEMRDCARCGCTIGKLLGIGARLQRARTTGDVAMVGMCLRALNPDPMTDDVDDSAIRSFVDAVAFEQLMARPVPGAQREVIHG